MAVLGVLVSLATPPRALSSLCRSLDAGSSQPLRQRCRTRAQLTISRRKGSFGWSELCGQQERCQGAERAVLRWTQPRSLGMCRLRAGPQSGGIASAETDPSPRSSGAGGNPKINKRSRRSLALTSLTKWEKNLSFFLSLQCRRCCRRLQIHVPQ